MAVFNTINFLPETFRSGTNQRFLGATMDQLFADAVNVPINGYIGRTFAPTFKLGDNYVPEISPDRGQYQLESTVVGKDVDGDVTFTSGYLDLLQGISNNSGFIDNHQRLFEAEYYNYDGKFDYDKFVNYYNYYWLPNGPTAIGVYANQTPYQATYAVTRNTNESGYTFNGLGTHANPQITVARGGSYEFTLNQPGSNFWIQTEPGTSGTEAALPTVTTRQVFGVQNNGASSGTVRFNVPSKSAQNFYIEMTLATTVDAAVTFSYTDIQNQLLSTFLKNFPTGVDGIANQLSGKTLVFIGNQIDDSFWTTPSPAGAITDTSSITPGSVIATGTRTNAWQITLVPSGTDYVIQLRPVVTVATLQKIFVRSGLTYASNQFWLNNNYIYTVVPPITANSDYLYYQDSNNPGFNGVIKIVDNESTPINIVKDIIGSKGYTSPNGVVFTNGLKVLFDSYVVPSSYANSEYYVDGVGKAITLTPVASLIVPESFGAEITSEPDYITINRSSNDTNAWSRYNRWFHKDVITSTATYNNTLANYGPNIPARRPIIEFEPGLKLFNNGSGNLQIVDIITLTSSDAFLNIEGQLTAEVDGVTLVTGQTIIFANDYDNTVRNKIWEVVIQKISNANFITLVDTGITVTTGLNVLSRSGGNAGTPYYYNGTSWVASQLKTEVNQSPMFDLVDNNGYSFDDTTVYPGSTFAGSKLFGYKVGSGTNDIVLGFPLSYQNFNSIGDIVYSNYYDTDTFTYSGGTVNCNSGYMLQNGIQVNNWITGVEDTKQYQVFTKFYEGLIVLDTAGVERAFVQVDVLPSSQASVPYTKVYVNNNLLLPSEYKLVSYKSYYVVQLLTTPNIGDKIDVLIYSEAMISNIGYYEIPSNLDLNPLNETFNTITLGQLRSHYSKLIENTSGTKPLQDSYLKAQGGTLIQHSSPAIYAAAFLNHPTVNFTDGITLARREYSRFKNKFLSLCSTLTTIDYKNPATGVDTILQNINAVKNSSFPWYYSDMVPQGNTFSTLSYTVINARQTQYEISSIFDNTVLSNRAVLVYVNGIQKTFGIDYTFSKISPAIIFTNQFTATDVANGTVITIREYANTDGNFIPETPTKLGLYPKFTPKKYVDTTYQNPTEVIQGHDGSITPAFGDFRDDYILELENRIYNNIKADYSTNEINLYNVIPGKFRNTGYSLVAYNHLLTNNFLQWVGINNVDFASNTWFDANNPWTWNYGSVADLHTKRTLQGSWRAIYDYWFDTDTPNLSPWEMLGFGSEPSWWVTRYGVGPYTSGNATLWEDLEAGYIWNDGNPYTDTRFARPGLSNFIPVDTAGNLLNPTQIPLTSVSIGKTAGNEYQVGEQGPVETAWRRSSDFPYAIQTVLSMAKPAQYFATQIDTSQFYRNSITGQFSTVKNEKVSPSMLSVNGDNTSGTIARTSGYINWMADNIKNHGIDPVTTINDFLSGFSVQLTYKLSGFADKNLITVTAEQTSPGATSASVIIPDENYQIYLNKSVPVATVTYSAVIVEKTSAGYAVTGYDTANPFFRVIPSISNNNSFSVTVNNISSTIYRDQSNSVITIPYGTVFTSIQQVTDFLVSYQRYLQFQGFTFEQFDSDLAETRNWILSVKEFLYWSQQGWGENTIIVLNPTATQLELNSRYATVDAIRNIQTGSKILDQNFVPIKVNNFNILRKDSPSGNSTTIDILDGSIICYARLNLVQSEHVIVFDNVTDFKDIIYVPSLGNRQYRLKLSGHKTGDWTGALSPAGYVYSNPTILDWSVNVDYKTGDIVTFNNAFYTATTDVPASTTFSFSSWELINNQDIQTGLLPSFGHNAQKFNQFYDVDNPPAEEDLQLVSSGLIGFRERPYLTDLGISITNQTKFYQGFIKQKGTVNAINALTKADFDNVKSSITTYEEWAFKVGQYGDLSNNKFNEFILDQGLFTTNPVAFTLSNTYNAGNIIVSFDSGNVYNSNDLSNITSLYSDREVSVYPTDLPTAGYVNIQDIDSQIFDITTADTSTVLGIGRGHKIWTAKDANNNWNVYRVNETGLISTSLSYSLDSYGLLTFNNRHNFSVGDLFILTQFETPFGNYNGLYEVVSVPNSTSITITIGGEFTNLRYLISASPLSAAGVVYSLGSMVIDSISELTSIRPITGWVNGDTVWVNNATSAGWGVYTYNQPWESNTSVKVTANTITANTHFGQSTRISTDTNTIYVGGKGQVQLFANINGTYTASTTLTSAESTFGSAIETQGNLLVVGSPASANVHIYLGTTPIQYIHSANATGRFGYSIAMSHDQHWLYIGEPTTNKVQAYWTANIGANVHYTQVGTIGTGIGNVGSAIKTNSTGTKLFVSAPQATNTTTQDGTVYVYTRTANAFALSQTLNAQVTNQYASFGTAIAIDGTAGNLFIGIPGSTDSGPQNGLVERYVLSSGSYVFDEIITHPDEAPGAFGSAISISTDGKVLAVGSNGSPSKEVTTFDNTALSIDSGTVTFIDDVLNSGAAYLFEPIADLTNSNDIGSYEYVQELETQVLSGDYFGAALDVSRTIIAVGAPGSTGSAGYATIFDNPTSATIWNIIRNQQPQVDINSINRTFLYNKVTNNILASLDFVDPNKGKVLTTVSQDIDFQLDRDPALYNQGTGTVRLDLHWGPSQVGKIWWNLDTIRYIDYEQDALIYRLNHWGEQFPGTSIDVYQWVESSVLPSEYVKNGGVGTPLHSDDSAYSTYGYVDVTGNVKIKYYYWVSGIDTVSAGKQNSILSIAEAIDNPQGQGVPYATVLDANTIALHNVNSFLNGTSTILHLGSKSIDAGLIHSEYTLVQEGNPGSVIPKSISNKFIDSLSGQDRAGNVVPDPTLQPSQTYGISIRPRQTMFVNKDLALNNYLSIVNPLLSSYPVVERKVLTTLNSSESVPNSNSGLYELAVSTIDELSYVDTTTLSPGYAVLVESDSTQNGKWAIYTLVTTGASFPTTPTRVQSYKTNLYWSYADWYDASYNPTSIPDITVANNLDLGKLKLTANTHIKVLNNGSGNFVIYYVDSTLTKNLVGIQNGTIQINTTGIPALELRQILTAVQSDILIDDLGVEYNSLFFSMIKYILTEQKNLDWVFKTSFLSATQYIRKLEQFPSYISDNQSYYLDYINEVKPYRTVLREFVVDYIGNDTYGSDITDFDLPPYWDANLSVYRSPTGSQTYDRALWQSGINSQWYENYKYCITNIVVEQAGTGYTTPPDIIIRGDGGTGATAYATLNGMGGIAEIVITNPGKNYLSPPDVIINGNGTGAIARPILQNVYAGNNTGHNLIRSIKTGIKFDRTTYTNPNTFVFWDSITTANIGQTLAADAIIVLNDNLYQLANAYTIDANVTFPTADVTTISAGTLNNANDRIIAYSGNINLASTQSGLEYPGVIVDGNTFVGNVYDSSISSAYTTSLGINPSDINIDGGAFYDIYNSYAPEELVPGRMYDSLNISVFDTNNLAFRFVDTMNGAHNFYRISAANTTTLSQTLSLTDTYIHVQNGLALPAPNKALAIPGVVFINGEKITYYRNYAQEIATPWTANLIVSNDSLISYSGNYYLTTGNVYAQYFANVSSSVTQIDINSLGQIRRGVDGTGASSTTYPIGTRVVDSSVQQAVPGAVTSLSTLTANTSYVVTDYISYGLVLTNPITANIGDFITQSNANVVTLTMRVLQSVAEATVVPVIITQGTAENLPEIFDGPLGFDVEAFDNTTGTISINGVNAGSYILNTYKLGSITDAATVTLPTGTQVTRTPIWYSPGVRTITSGAGLVNSTTEQAEFLIASKGYTP